jgi:hypothetical protein
MPRTHHHRPALLALALAAAALSGCESGGHFTVLGYTTRPNYDTRIHTIYVPTFTSQVLIDSTRRTLHIDLTKAVIREIEAKTPYKVVSDCSAADTELTGNILGLTKQLLNRNQLNEIREAETVLTVGIVWKDLRTGEILSRPRKGPTALPTPGIPALDIPDVSGLAPPPLAPPPVPLPPGVPKPEIPPVIVTGIGDYIPELGQSNATAYQQAINRVAVQIVSLMEKPW